MNEAEMNRLGTKVTVKMKSGVSFENTFNPYEVAIVVDNLVFLSGMTAQDTKTGACLTDTIRDQMVVCLDKVKAALEEVGSSMENIIKTLILLKDVKDYQMMRKTELEYYQKHAPRLVEEPPASTFMQPASLARPEFLVEIDVIAVLKRD
jgi:2-iminobutanoate/2-iminopropanoate deaminase